MRKPEGVSWYRVGMGGVYVRLGSEVTRIVVYEPAVSKGAAEERRRFNRMLALDLSWHHVPIIVTFVHVLSYVLYGN